MYICYWPWKIYCIAFSTNIPRPQLCNNFKIYKAKLSMYTYIYILKFFSNFQWKCPAWTCYYHQDPECLTNTFKDFTCYPHALFNGFSLQKACRFLLLVLYVSVWNSGLCYVGQCGEKWQVFPVNRVAPCTKWLSSRSIYTSVQNESTFTFNFHFKIPHILDRSILIDFELNLSLMSLLI